MHSEGPICKACVGHLVYPWNGTNTPLFDTCFAKVDEMCASDAGPHLSFCRDMVGEHDLPHVLTLENWKLANCDWSEPYDHNLDETGNRRLATKDEV